MSIKRKNNKSHSEAQKDPKLIKKIELCDEFLEIETNQWKELLKLNYDTNVAYIYNPLDYAKEPHEDYIKKFCQGKKEVLLVGMNPGPWGMCQTGVPFGEVNHVKNWLKIEGNISKPIKEHKQKLIEGFNCQRSEVSGERLWKLLKDLSGEPKRLFQHTFLHNYCPLAFLSETGKNITPADFKAKSRCHLEKVCDKSLSQVVKLLDIKYLVCIGNYVAKRAEKALAEADLSEVKISTLMHPSPINPKANKGWNEIAIKQLNKANVLHFIKRIDS